MTLPRLSDLPPAGKLFVGIFTTLMLAVCLWAVVIYYVEKGMVDDDTELPAYLTEPVTEDDRQEDIEAITDDPEAVLAPQWDSTLAGMEAAVDTATMADEFRKTDSEMYTEAAQLYDDEYEDKHERLEHNVGLAHTHINGQTLLFFAIGLVFLFSSAPVRTKKILYWIFGTSVLLHVIGLTGQGYFRLFDDILALSGLAILLVIAYMAFLIYVDLGKPRSQS